MIPLSLSLSLFLSLAHSFSLFLSLTRSLGPRIVMGKGPIGSGPMRVGRGGASSSLSLFFLVKSPGGPLKSKVSTLVYELLAREDYAYYAYELVFSATYQSSNDTYSS